MHKVERRDCDGAAVREEYHIGAGLGLASVLVQIKRKNTPIRPFSRKNPCTFSCLGLNLFRAHVGSWGLFGLLVELGQRVKR